MEIGIEGSKNDKMGSIMLVVSTSSWPADGYQLNKEILLKTEDPSGRIRR
jgi:hypothetical protein